MTRDPDVARHIDAFNLNHKLQDAAHQTVISYLLIELYAPTARWWTQSSGEHQTLGEARGRVRLDLPDWTADVRFYQHLRPKKVVVVDFAIADDAFLEWAARQGWKPDPVVGSVTVWPRSAFGDWATVVTVTDGHGYHTLRRGEPGTFSVTYDRGTRRAFYGFRSEPLDGD